MLFLLGLVLLAGAIIYAKTRESSEPDSYSHTINSVGDLDTPAATASIATYSSSVIEQRAPQQTTIARPKLAGKIICIDPGHASNPDLGSEPIGPGSSETKVKDPGGTSGVVSGVREPVVNLAISLALKQLLEADGATVVMTRGGPDFNGGNIERAQIANQAKADLFVRIHADGSTNPSQSGASTLYPALIPGWTDGIYVESKKAARVVQASMVSDLGVTDGGAVERSDMTGFNWSKVPVVLVECGFMTNAAEDRNLNSTDYQRQIAKALTHGIEDYFSG